MSIAGLNTSKRTRLQWYINKKEDVFQSLRRRIRLVTVGIRNTGRSAPDITYLGRDTLAGTVQTRDGALGLVGVERLKKKKEGDNPSQSRHVIDFRIETTYLHQRWIVLHFCCRDRPVSVGVGVGKAVDVTHAR